MKGTPTMPAKAIHYSDQRNDAMQLVAALCHVPTRNDVILSNPGTKAAAYSYRQRIYRWRRTVLAILAHPETPECRQCLEDLRPFLGARFCKDWLDYTRFDIVPPEDGRNKEGWRVRGSLSRPMYGPDIVFADSPEVIANHEDIMAILKAGLASRPGAEE